MIIELFVHGRAASAGSKTGFINKKTGKIIMTPASKYTKPWVEAVKGEAIFRGYNGKFILENAIKLSIEFHIIRPKGHYKEDGTLKKSARPYPTVQPDLTKLIRSTEDALTGLIWRDDSQVVKQETSKIYKLPQGAVIKIEEIK